MGVTARFPKSANTEWQPKIPAECQGSPGRGGRGQRALFCHKALVCSHLVSVAFPLFLTLHCCGNPGIQGCSVLPTGALFIICHCLIPSVGHGTHMFLLPNPHGSVFPLCLFHIPGSTHTMCLDIFAGSRGLWNMSAISGLFVWVFFFSQAGCYYC